jgi:3-oxoacyl-(acyl-carrier-protein) synthase
MNAGEEIAITRVGATCSVGETAPAVFAALCKGARSISPAPWEGKGPVGRTQDSSDSTLSSDLAIQVVQEATAGMALPDQVAVVGATTSGDMRVGEEAWFRQQQGQPLAVPTDFLWRQLAHGITQKVCQHLGTTGVRLTVSTACTSGAVAIGLAADLIRSGRAPAALAVGTDALCKLTLHGFGALGALSAEAAQPFDTDRSGLNLGEGAAALYLEPVHAAIAAGRTPLALLEGFGNTSDAHRLTAPDPTGDGARRAMVAALGAVPRDTVSYVCAHGTATRLNDAMEQEAIGTVLPGADFSSIKGAVGHTLGAAGALEAVVAILSLVHGQVPPNTGLTTPEPGPEPLSAGAPLQGDRTMSVNFAFGGHNTALLFRRWEPSA